MDIVPNTEDLKSRNKETVDSGKFYLEKWVIRIHKALKKMDIRKNGETSLHSIQPH